MCEAVRGNMGERGSQDGCLGSIERAGWWRMLVGVVESVAWFGIERPQPQRPDFGSHGGCIEA